MVIRGNWPCSSQWASLEGAPWWSGGTDRTLASHTPASPAGTSFNNYKYILKLCKTNLRPYIKTGTGAHKTKNILNTGILFFYVVNFTSGTVSIEIRSAAWYNLFKLFKKALNQLLLSQNSLTSKLKILFAILLIQMNWKTADFLLLSVLGAYTNKADYLENLKIFKYAI